MPRECTALTVGVRAANSNTQTVLSCLPWRIRGLCGVFPLGIFAKLHSHGRSTRGSPCGQHRTLVARGPGRGPGPELRRVIRALKAN